MFARFIRNGLLLFVAFAVLYLAAFVLLYRVPYSGAPMIYAVSDVLKFKGGDSWMRFREFEPEAHHDVVAIGSSHAYRGYDPRIFARHGWSMFNLGSSAQSPLNSWFVFEHYLNPQNTGLLLLDVYEVAMEIDGLESTVDLSQCLTSNDAVIRMALAQRDPRAINILMLRWFDRNEPPRYLDSNYVSGGFSQTRDSIKAPIHYLTGRHYDPEPRQVHFFRKILERCHATGIPVVLVCHPYPKQADRAKHEEFSQWLRDEAAPYGFSILDMAFDHGLPLDDHDHFYDHNHLNQAGVEIFDAVLIDRLEAMGLLHKPSP